MRLKKKWLWEITTFDHFRYVYQLDRFVHEDNLPDYVITSFTSTHSRVFRNKRVMMKFLRSDHRCPRGGSEGWIVLRWERNQPTAGRSSWGIREWGTMTKSAKPST